jgi:hypothetical protein
MELALVSKENLHHTNICIGNRLEIIADIHILISAFSKKVSKIERLIYEFDKFLSKDAQYIFSKYIHKVNEDEIHIAIIAFNSTNIETQNSMLKILEEPPAHTYFFLLVPSKKILLPTILSRAQIFEYKKQISGEPITLNWDTSNVVNMSWMFHSCKQEFILNFDTQKVENMAWMFDYATNFNQPLNFDTKNVKSMFSMFSNATNFNQPLNFDTSNVSEINNMFKNAFVFNQPIYFKAINGGCDIFYNSPMEGQETKYVLTSGYYNKLFVMYALNCVNPELLYLLDEFEEFYDNN